MRHRPRGNVPDVRIVVCVKHVPDIQSDRTLGDTGRVVRDGGDGTLNELDENALEAALALAEAAGGEVVALTVGPDDAVDAVRKGLQMGADEAVHVLDDAIAGSDVVGTARVLAAAITPPRDRDARRPRRHRHGGPRRPDVAAADRARGPARRPGAAARRARSRSTAATVRVRRNLDHATEVLEASLPALVSVTDQANEPRYPNFKGIMAARKKPVTTLSLADLGLVAGGRRHRRGAHRGRRGAPRGRRARTACSSTTRATRARSSRPTSSRTSSSDARLPTTAERTI